MRTAYRVLAYVIAVEVAVQADVHEHEVRPVAQARLLRQLRQSLRLPGPSSKLARVISRHPVTSFPIHGT